MRTNAFRTLGVIELIAVAVVISIGGMLIVPRLGHAATIPTKPATRAHLETLRSAIERYCYDHVAWPAQMGDGEHAAGSEAAFIAQLTRYTDRTGVTSQRKSERFRFGPYLRDGIPACPVEPRLGFAGVCIYSDDRLPRFEATAADAGWVYNCQTGTIAANSNVLDENGQRYDEY